VNQYFREWQAWNFDLPRWLNDTSNPIGEPWEIEDRRVRQEQFANRYNNLVDSLEYSKKRRIACFKARKVIYRILKTRNLRELGIKRTLRGNIKVPPPLPPKLGLRPRPAEFYAPIEYPVHTANV
jgi:hypothetical protein